MNKLKPQKVAAELRSTRQSAFKRFPLPFALLGTFGVVATFYGLEGVIDTTPLKDHPFILMLIGIFVLSVTGTVYKKLG